MKSRVMLSFLLLFAASVRPAIAQNSNIVSSALSSVAVSSAPASSGGQSSALPYMTVSPTSDPLSHSPERSSSRDAPASIHYTSYSQSGTGLQSTPTSGASHAATSKIPDIDTLPIRPRITPAFALAGFILIISGLVLALVGVRAKKLHTFLSTAYLVALAVTVLVTYVADPPVSDAVQGAYFVAALLSGCIIGGLSLVFTDITQGLGCLLGGFCLAMWLLSLKEGGLIPSVGGRVGLIAAFCVFASALSFSKHTWTFGLMGCTAFAGATIIVLGIDCYSRAGLKEFWVYIWDLNSDLFPLNTNTYPMTRGMKVEVAAIMIVFLCGLLSQIKLYGIFKQRLDKKTARHAQDEEDRDHLEADIGRRIEDTNMRERELWERKYNDLDKGHMSAAASVADSTNPPTATNSRAQSVKDMTMNVREVASPDAEAMEMMTLQAAKKAEVKGGDYSVHVRSMNDEHTDHPPFRPERLSTQYGFEGRSLRPAAPPPPVVVPMPFTISERELVNDDDARSGASFAVTAAEPKVQKTGNLGRNPDLNQSVRAIDDYSYDPVDGDLEIPHLEDDRASSVAATLDDLTDDENGQSLPAFSRPASPSRTRFVKTRSLRQSSSRRAGSVSDLSQPPSLPDSAISGIKPRRRVSDPAPSELVDLVLESPESKAPEDLSNILDLITGDKSKRWASQRNSIPSETASKESASATMSLADVKDAKPLSKLALKYRTHEWTKFLDDADMPDFDDLKPTDGGIQVERRTSSKVEKAAPVNVRALQQTTVDDSRHNSINSTNPYRVANRQSSTPDRYSRSMYSDYAPTLPRSNSNPNTITTIDTPAVTSQRPSTAGSAAPFQRSVSTPMIHTRSLRHTTMPLAGQPLTESPIEHEYDSTFPGRSTPIPGSTLLSMRENIMRRNTTTVQSSRPVAPTNHTLMRNASHNSMTNRPGTADNGSLRGMSLNHPDADNVSLSSRRDMLNDDEMPLSRRRTLMQQGVNANSQSGVSQAPSRRASDFQSTSHQSPLHSNPEPHQPQRSSTVDTYTRQARMASFRDSVRKDAGHKTQLAQISAAEEDRRFQMLQEKRHTQAQVQQKQWERGMLDNAVDQRMRSGEMLGTHRELLRRMQRGASGNE